MAVASVTTKHKLIGFKAFFDRDEDIVRWWEAMPAGERSQVLRSLIRAFLSGEIAPTPQGEAPTAFSRSVQLAHVQSDTRWIRDALLEMPAYLEDLFSRFQRPTGGNGSPTMTSPPTPMMPAPTLPIRASSPAEATELSDSEAAQRAERMLKKRW